MVDEEWKKGGKKVTFLVTRILFLRSSAFILSAGRLRASVSRSVIPVYKHKSQPKIK